MKARIVERTEYGKRVCYVIQQKFLWLWVDAYRSSSPYCWCNSFYSLQSAKAYFHYFDTEAAKEKRPIDRVVFE